MNKVSSRLVSAVTAAMTLVVLASSPSSAFADDAEGAPFKHVLLISVDGLHQKDVDNYVKTHRGTNIERLMRHGVSYTNASTSTPSDSFPGLTALVTGASPKATGVYYDDSYDRKLSPVGDFQCATIGAETMYAENLDFSYDVVLGGSTRLDAGGGIDPKLLPLSGANGCTPVYPHQFLRVNTIFNVAAAHDLYTAWSDKHPAYELVRGPANTGAEELYTPEINSPPHDLACTAKEGPGGNVDDHCAILDINAQ